MILEEHIVRKEAMLKADTKVDQVIHNLWDKPVKLTDYVNTTIILNKI